MIGNRVKVLRLTGIALLLIIFASLSGCVRSDSPKDVSEQFWKAVQERDMESAKQVATWDTVDYLKYLKVEKLHPEHFDLGDVMQGEARSEVTTTLYTKKLGQSGIKLPGVTVLVMTEKGWRVDVKKTLNSIVKLTVDNAFNQLNGLMQEGLKELDKTLSESLGEVGKALEEGAKELRKELSQPLIFPDGN